jgi:transglutaminase-like putative cysteine protease
MNSPASTQTGVAIRLQFSIELNYQIYSSSSDFIFSIHAANTNHQVVISENLEISQNIPTVMYTGISEHSRLLRLKATCGSLKLVYSGVIDLTHFLAPPNLILETLVSSLPGEILTYLYPSRYCQSDFMQDIAIKQFGAIPQGYYRIQAIRDWVLQHVSFQSNSSTAHTTAIDTYLTKKGVCRDFAHLMITLCRALSIPARFVTGIDYGSDPILGPTDFHAYVEVYLGGHWYIFDPSGVAIPMGFLRISTGHDAADTAIATIFGSVRGSSPIISIRAIPNAQGILELPRHVPYALSTDG